MLLELLQPNKTDVLAYLSGSSGPPDRWARVVVQQGATEQMKQVIYTVTFTRAILVSPILTDRNTVGTVASDSGLSTPPIEFLLQFWEKQCPLSYAQSGRFVELGN